MTYKEDVIEKYITTPTPPKKGGETWTKTSPGYCPFLRGWGIRF